MKMPSRFIVIDDDPINNIICEHTIKHAFPGIAIKTFNLPITGFKYVCDYANNDAETSTVLFLDINMPEWTGWDFLDHFETLDETIKKQFSIYILSSSVNQADMKRAKEYKDVVNYIIKPLSAKIISDLLEAIPRHVVLES